MIPHINLSSFAGGGKTTVSRLLLETYRTVMIPKITTRPRRPTEEIPEYIFVSGEEFEFRQSQGQFLAIEEIAVNGGLHHHAIPKVEYWPTVPEGTQLILSAFGEHARFVQTYVPEIKLVFISLRDRNLLKERLRQRCVEDGGNFEKKWVVNEKYFSANIESKYDFIVYNDTTPEDCVAQIMALTQER